jgi:hypothetical protein
MSYDEFRKKGKIASITNEVTTGYIYKNVM